MVILIITIAVEVFAFPMSNGGGVGEVDYGEAEAAVYEQILADYPNYGTEIGVDIKKYLERAQDAASK